MYAKFMFSVKSHFLHSVWRGGAEWIQKFSHFIPKYGHVSQDVVNEILSKYCRLPLLLTHRSSALKTLGFLCKASQSVCCFEFSHNLTIWVYCENMRYFSASSNNACLKRVRGQQSDDVSKKIPCRDANNIKSEEQRFFNILLEILILPIQKMPFSNRIS